MDFPDVNHVSQIFLAAKMFGKKFFMVQFKISLIYIRLIFSFLFRMFWYMSIRRLYPGDILMKMSDNIENIAVTGGNGLLSKELKKVNPSIKLFDKNILVL